MNSVYAPGSVGNDISVVPHALIHPEISGDTFQRKENAAFKV